MKKYMTIEMPDKSIWKVPTAIIACHRATHYAQEFDGNFQKSMGEDTLPLFNSDEYEIEDWAQNNMNWKDVEKHAVMVSSGEINYEEGWANGEKDFTDD